MVTETDIQDHDAHVDVTLSADQSGSVNDGNSKPPQARKKTLTPDMLTDPIPLMEQDPPYSKGFFCRDPREGTITLQQKYNVIAYYYRHGFIASQLSMLASGHTMPYKPAIQNLLDAGCIEEESPDSGKRARYKFKAFFEDITPQAYAATVASLLFPDDLKNDFSKQRAELSLAEESPGQVDKRSLWKRETIDLTKPIVDYKPPQEKGSLYKEARSHHWVSGTKASSKSRVLTAIWHLQNHYGDATAEEISEAISGKNSPNVITDIKILAKWGYVDYADNATRLVLGSYKKTARVIAFPSGFRKAYNLSVRDLFGLPEDVRNDYLKKQALRISE